jgi:outer membrane protein assembly factor BamD (BamD/ComL family)
MKSRIIASAAIAAALLVSCASAPKVIPEDLSARELVQRAQESTDAYNYAAATAYYDALRQRFGSDPLYETTAEYEIAFIEYKQGRYAAAKSGFEALLARYAGPDASTLPQRYAVLSKKMLESIAEKTKAGKK